MHQEDGEEDEPTEHGKRKVKRMLDPKLPNEVEVREHYLSGRIPYRNWCPHCARGRGREMDHGRKAEDEQPGIPEYHMDYCFPGDDTGEKITVLVIVEMYTKMKKAVVVPSKGSTGSFATRMVLDLIRECGDGNRDVIVKTDQEPAIKFLVDDVCVFTGPGRGRYPNWPRKIVRAQTGWWRGPSRQWSSAFGP